MDISPPVRAAPRLRQIAELPGPRGLPWLGNALQIERERLHQQAEAWAEEYGEVYRFALGERQLVVLSNPEVVAAVLRDRPDGFARSTRLGDIAREFGFDGVFTANGQAWRRQRPMVMAGLDPAHIKAFFPTLVRVTERLMGRWTRAAAAGQAIDLQGDLMRYTVDVTAGLAFGTDINTVESGQEVIQQHLDKILPALFRRLVAPFPYWRWVTLPQERALAGHLAALHTAVRGFIDAARGRLAGQPGLRERPRNLIEAMLVEREREGSALTDADVVGNVLTMLLAGEDTTANTLAWLIWLLNENPTVILRAGAEVQAVLDGGTHPTQYEQLARFDYLEACIHETMRLKPVAPIMILQAAQDRELAGVAIPGGTLVMCLMRPGAVAEANFPDAKAFRPERWLAGGGPAQAASSARRVAMPFGAGPRICPGRYLAMAEMKMVAAMLLASFRIDAVDAPGGKVAEERLAFTMSPVGLRMRLGK
ncbi:cytochrome P450 [Ideonella sp.]|uniref:cytochrome P450 n=1 Tax=Ideonella sp. TaxID=1929293 RepID=UPI002B4881BE|nr:cytochrome P450 [Ideonella sp.]HJV68995.1 cytochrome P450 [Ideonella sp.]